MLDLATISEEVLLARGQYATVRGAHENAKKELAAICGELQSHVSQILRKLQEDDIQFADAAPLIAKARVAVQDIQQMASTIESLAEQRAELRKTAWPK